MHDPRELSPAAGQPRGFATTHWSLVLRAGHRDGPGDDNAQAALTALCSRYWYPLYAYVRRRVADVHEAQDLTQAFFTRLLEKHTLASAAPERGRFRSFLLTSLQNFLNNEWHREHARKRGGGVQTLSFDLDSGESRLTLEPAHDLTPERMFERQWVLTLLELVMGRLQAECEAAGKGDQFQLLRGALAGQRDQLPYVELAQQLGLSEDAARQAASRLRKRYRQLLREEVAQTTAEPGDVDDEIRGLFAALAG